MNSKANSKPPIRKGPANKSAKESDRLFPMRLNKRMAELGLCSRREADEFIAKGWVSVNGEIVDTLGLKVNETDEIELRYQAQMQTDRLVSIALYKPVGYVSAQAEDGHTPAWELLTKENCHDPREAFDARNLRNLAVMGRLDIDSRGLLLFSQDGRLARKLIGEDSKIEKEYHVLFREAVSDEELLALKNQKELDGVPLKKFMVERLAPKQLKFILKEGRKRHIRRLCELVDLQVYALIRVRVGHLKLNDLKEGQWKLIQSSDIF